MTERLLRERLGYLTDEFDQHPSGHLRSVSPHQQGSPRRHSRSPRPSRDLPVMDSRPDVAPWPNPYTDTNKEDIMTTKLAAAKPRVRETELKEKIQTLEDTVAEYERQKHNVMGTFSEYRERVAERERKLEAEYSTKIIALSEEVLNAKKDFEERMKSFQALQDKFQREKETALEKLRAEHQKEIQLLEQRFSESQLLNLEQKYMIEIQRLQEERKSLKSEKERLGETFESKLRRAQSLYETELTAAKMLYSKELEALRDHEEALKEELTARQEEFHDRLMEMQRQTERSKEELQCCKNEVAALEKRLDQKQAEVLAISKELEEARTETNQSLVKLAELEDELNETKQKHRQQEEELQRKSNLLNIVETAKTKLESVIKDLQAEVKNLKNKVEFLEKERANLQSQSESQAQLQNSQVHALEAVGQVLESVTKEKETTKEHYENLLDQERSQAEEREYAMKKEFGKKLNEIEDQYNVLKDQFDSKLVEERFIVRQEVKEEMKEEMDDLKEQNRKSQTQSGLEQADAGRPASSERQPTEGIDEEKETRTEKTCSFYDVHRDEIEQLKQSVRSEIRSQLEQEQVLARDDSRESENALKGKPEASDIKMSEMEKNDSAESSDERTVSKTVPSESVTEESDETNEELKASQERIKILEAELEGMRQQLQKQNSEAETREMEIPSRVEEKQDFVDQFKARENELREEIERELRSKFSEAAAENHVIEVEAFEKQLQDYKEQMDVKEREGQDRLQAMVEELSTKDDQIEYLHKRVKDLMGEVESIQSDLDKKTEEVKNFGKKTDQYIRKREQQQMSALERKMDNLKADHEQALVQVREREEQLVQQLQVAASARDTLEREVESKEVQTVGDLSEELEMIIQEKDDMIRELQQELAVYSSGCEDARKDRSQSLAAVTDDPTKRNRPMNKFQCLVSQITDKKKEKKSPGLLSRLRDRSPHQHKAVSPAPTASSSRQLLSPSDAERGAERRSPSRQLFSRSKQSTTDKERRPAWKI